eukprot:216541-Chlamydomonas_euryale.AAC.1
MRVAVPAKSRSQWMHCTDVSRAAVDGRPSGRRMVGRTCNSRFLWHPGAATSGSGGQRPRG